MGSSAHQSTEFFDSLPGAGDVQLPIEQYYTLNKVNEKRAKNYGLTFTSWECRVRGLSKIPYHATPRAIYLILESVLDRVLADAKPDDKVRLSLHNSKGFKRPIWVPPLRRSQLSVDRIMMEVEHIIQSNEAFRLDECFELRVQHAVVPAGKGGDDRKTHSLLRSRIGEKHCVTQVRNKDEICLARAIVIGKALADGDRKLYRTLHHTKGSTDLTDKTLQTIHAKALIALTGLPYRRYSLEDVVAFQTVLPDYRIIVVGVAQMNSVVYSGPVREKRIMLLLHGDHFDVLTSLSVRTIEQHRLHEGIHVVIFQGWFERTRYCFTCMKGFDHRESHRCEVTCRACLRQNCESATGSHDSVYCSDCYRKFYGRACFDEHKRQPGGDGRSICEKFYVCQMCLHFVSLANRSKLSPTHQCGEVFCKNCTHHVMPEAHVCYMKPELLTPQKLAKFKNAKFLYFDLETYSDKGLFVANYACVQDDYGNSWTFPPTAQEIGARDITDDLCSFIFQKKHADYIVVAHNLKGWLVG